MSLWVVAWVGILSHGNVLIVDMVSRWSISFQVCFIWFPDNVLDCIPSKFSFHMQLKFFFVEAFLIKLLCLDKKKQDMLATNECSSWYNGVDQQIFRCQLVKGGNKLLYCDELVHEISQTSPSPEWEVKGTKCCGAWVHGNDFINLFLMPIHIHMCTHTYSLPLV